MPVRAQEALVAWRSIVPLVRAAVAGKNDADLDRTGADDAMSLRETVHHVVEANVVAASIVVAALGSPGCTYDWSWMMPFGPWMDHMRYDRKPLAPALKLLEALNEYVAAQIEPLPDALERRVLLRDQPGGDLREVTVAQILLQEAEHAREELGEAPQPDDRP